ncbi:hypothetical protein LR48_Vigan10g214300 [Vigna angularis]|uniref:Uncharacterized protein n=2 Tax=Phaseolus angularis TaxID=3914 RepID=A0A0S3T999_PHAAN|nr:UPF0481 protein At3g47200 [Vigna angularis]KAG2384272.1 putative UPF0481 protein [Vigna angularis]KOM56251.1 hypothetical protein LR48_Vigan10g214300 [Vigna angularis]BAU01540.1 hypothetical protein VIGAN_11079400 [Vigna angularis var. angularis]
MNPNFSELEKAKETPQNTVPKIQKVAHYLRDRKHSKKHYSPRLLSIGPIHHGEPNLELGEKYKRMWAAKYLERTKQDGETLYEKFALHVNQLKEQYAEDVVRHFRGDDENFSWMLFVDGCSLLQILDKGNLSHPEDLNAKVDQLVLVWQDVLLLENQLPYEVLLLLSGHQNDDTLVNSMNKFLECHHLSPKQRENTHGTTKFKKNEDRVSDEDGDPSVYVRKEDSLRQEHIIDIRKEPPFHLLDQLRRYIVGDAQKEPQHQKGDAENGERDEEKNEDLDVTTYRNIEELKAAGIKLKVKKSRNLRDISFSYRWMWLRAELTLPEITVDDTTAPTFHNLIAYEMCPDFENNFEISSFVAFMDSLIDHPEDVKELRSAKVLFNSLGSDEEVAKLFNTISADLVPNSESYLGVRRKIEKHYRKRYRAWLALGYHTYFSNPWSIIAFLAALLALVLTFIQAWFAIHPVC